MADYSGFECLKIEREDKVLVVTFNRPDSLNAMNDQMHQEFDQFLGQLTLDNEVGAVVLTGAGRAFCAGGDVKGMSQRNSSEADRMSAVLARAREGRRKLVNLLEVEQPIIAAVNGDAIGLGATIALLCDVVYAAEDARIADTHVKVGLVAGDGGSLIWPLLIGVNKAKEYLMTGDMINGREAERIGLVNKALPREEVLPAAKALATRLANGPSLAIRWTKVAVNKHLRDTLSQMVETSLSLEVITMLSEDHKEAARAFVEKRPPKFNGR